MSAATEKSTLWPDGKGAYTLIWWVTFTLGGARCFEGEADSVRLRAEAIGDVKTIRPLPYPAQPREAPQSECPAFCHSPSTCQGRTSCPKRYSCSE